jgi:hypothetical protein
MPQHTLQQQVNINPDDLTDISCHECDGKHFVQVYRMKKLSALISPDGQEQLVTMPMFICNDCGAVPKEYLPND